MGVGGVVGDLVGFEWCFVFLIVEVEMVVLGDFEFVDCVGDGYWVLVESEVEWVEIGERCEVVVFVV